MSATSPMLYAWVGSLLVPPAILACDYAFLRGNLSLLRAAMLSFATIVAMISTTASLYDRHLEAELAAFDLNDDGIFAGAEVTTEQEQALASVTNDVSRTFAPITGSLFAFCYSAVFFALLGAVRRARGRAKSAA